MDPVEKSFLYKDRAFRFVGEYNPVHEQLKGAFELAKLFADDEDFDFTKKVDEKYDPKLCVPGGTTMIDGDTRQWNTIHEIAVEEHPEGYKIKFNREKYLETKQLNVVVLPNKFLAYAIVAEWEMQRDVIRKTTLPLTELACRTQDIIAHEEAYNELKEDVLSYFEGEQLCHREGIKPTDSINERIEKHWDPFIEWFNKYYNVKLKIFRKFTNFNVDGQIPYQVYARLAVEKDIKDIPPHRLVALHEMIEAAQSAVLGIALYKKAFSFDEVLDAAQLMERESTSGYGFVMGEHDVRFSEQSLNLSAAQTFIALYESK